MPDYKKMYSTLFNSITDVIEILEKAQESTEREFIESQNSEIIRLLGSDRFDT